MIPLKELELIDNFCKYLKVIKYKYKRELRKGSYHNEGYIDVVIKDGIFIAVEAKVKNFTAVFHQACGNRVAFPINYILYPKLPSKKSLEKLKQQGIGLIIPEKNIFKVFVKPLCNFAYMDYVWYMKIKRNWKENRCGRKFSTKEISQNYREKDIKDLECTYDWNK